MGDENQGFARPERKKRKFDISSPVGIIVGFAIVIAAIMLGGGGIKAFKNFLDVSSILIVIGGTTHAHQLKNFHYPQVTKNVILSKKLAR
ncbi:hypothetical protein PDQ70_28230, partial [Bacillus cereus group sp. Bc011]|nr:hypothetical protein [Bacillus cereus group sp. Bc032]MDA2677739.1 hypothetical protein [Bacillus cereus group sp. Bc031]MDA2683245.1 hypothetical protein [Bacillus cereus group sp. Bc029]MDA2688674.1 hypothetical protein [Bacillus cereus group sp. Bc030]MDA2744217.1 hypothetical protein [Bacillus cereus group sp. Bc011]